MAENQGTVFVERKTAMSYVRAIITSLSSSNAKEITLKARGQAITTAVDVAEITRNRFLEKPKSQQDRNRNRRDATKRRRKQIKNGFYDGNSFDEIMKKEQDNRKSIDEPNANGEQFAFLFINKTHPLDFCVFSSCEEARKVAVGASFLYHF